MIKRCPRCGGNFFTDHYGEENCLQCGYSPPPEPLSSSYSTFDADYYGRSYAFAAAHKHRKWGGKWGHSKTYR